MMTRHEFRNAVYHLSCIDYGVVPEISKHDWPKFRDDPIRFLNRAPDGIADAIWAEVERRMEPLQPAIAAE